MQLYSLNSVFKEIENITNIKYTWCKTGFKLFTQEIHLIVNIV